MKKMGRIFGALVMTAVAPLAHSGASELVGIWEGTGKQPSSSWTAKISAASDRVVAVDYASLGCGGRLHFVERTASSWVYEERLSYGRSKCDDRGRMELTLDESGSLIFLWTRPGKETSTGTLRKWE